MGHQPPLYVSLKPLPVFDHSHDKKVFPNAHLSGIGLCLSHPAIGSQGEETGIAFCTSTSQEAAASCEAESLKVMNKRSIKVDMAIEHYLILENKIVEKLRKNRPIYISIYFQF